MAVTYVHPSSGAEVVDVKCPKGHAGGKGHVAAGVLWNGTNPDVAARCGHILKSHKVTDPEETVNGKKVKPVRTVVDQACEEFLVPADTKSAEKAAKAAKADADEAAENKAKLSGKSGKSKGKKTEKHPQAV